MNEGKAEAARLRGEAQLDKDLSALATEVRKHAPVLGIRGGLEERLWAALDRLVGLLETRLAELEAGRWDPDFVGDAAGSAEAVRNIAETMDRLGLLKPSPPPVEAPEPDLTEVRAAAKEVGVTAFGADRLVKRLRERGADLPRTRQETHHGPGVRRYDDEDDGDPS